MTSPIKGSTRRGDQETEVSGPNRRVDLHASEIELLLKACRKYRARLPAYLQSAKEETGLADSIIAKLSEILE